MHLLRGVVSAKLLPLLLVMTSAASAARAAADSTSSVEQILAGVVVSTQPRFTADHSRIVTESVVEQTDGNLWTVTQRGGEVAGYGMLVNDAPPLLESGDRVELRARLSQTRRGEPAWTVATVDRLERVPEHRAAGFELLHARLLTRATQVPLYWASGCIFVTLDVAGTAQIPGDLELPVMSAVFDHWVAATEDCSYLRFVMDAPSTAEVGVDRRNVVLFRDDRWCTPATDDAPEECHDSGTVGLTTTTYVTSQSDVRFAEIVDVDIELNAVDYVFTVDAASLAAGPGCTMDLAAVLTHEVGHMLGLAHSCLMPEDDPSLRDENGQPLLPCRPYSALPEAIRDATMAGEATCGDARKATVETDDIHGVCSLFPLSADPGTCQAPATLKTEARCDCSNVGASGFAVPWALIASAVLLGARVRGRGRHLGRGRVRWGQDDGADPSLPVSPKAAKSTLRGGSVRTASLP
ncbi:MAG: hypothetical protein JW751_17975 [Polyangiaceae bacterium]|nr:hypothetical protein [Polyangiaceae bacterium]